MSGKRRIPALTTEEAVRSLLTRLGLDYVPSSPAGEKATAADHVLCQLERHGLPARLAQLDAAELPYLEFPTLIQLRDSRWLLAVKKRHRGIVAEDITGRHYFLSWPALEAAFSGIALERIPELPSGRTLWSRVWQLLWAHRRLLYQIVALALVAQGLNLLFPQLTRILVDRIFPEETLNLFQVVILAMVIIALFQAWTGWLQRRFAVHLQIRLDAILERGLLIHVLHLPYDFLERKTIGQLLQGFQGFSLVRGLLTGETVGAFLGGLTAVAFLVFMGQLMLVPTFIVAAVGAVALIITIAAGQRQETLQQEHVQAFTKQRGYAAELFNNIAMLKAAGAEDRSARHWLTLLQKERHIGLHGERVRLGSSVAVDLLGQLQLQALWIWGGLHVLAGSLQLGELLAFTLLAGAFHEAVGNFGRSVVTIWTAKPYLQEAQTLLARQPLPRTRASMAGRAPGPIEIRDLWFRYGRDLPWVLRDFKLAVEPGEVRRIEGPSGFGKSTLLKLVAGLYEPNRGGIRLSGHTPREAREQLLYLPQFVRLFNMSILENLRLLSNGASRRHLLTVAEFTGLADLVKELPMGYETFLAQGGGNFSGGQRQLIALTAVLASERPVLLLDEAMANIDPLQWARIENNPLIRDKTILYTSHTKSGWEKNPAASAPLPRACCG